MNSTINDNGFGAEQVEAVLQKLMSSRHLPNPIPVRELAQAAKTHTRALRGERGLLNRVAQEAWEKENLVLLSSMRTGGVLLTDDPQKIEEVVAEWVAFIREIQVRVQTYKSRMAMLNPSQTPSLFCDEKELAR